MPGAQSKLVSQVSAIDMSGGGGNDNINVLQTAPFANKPIRIYGNDGDDTINLDLRADGSAEYSAEGGNGWDTVNVPNWMPVGPGGFPYSLWTNAESRNLSTLAQAQGTLRQNGDMTSIWRQIQAPITNGSNNRSADRYRLLTEQFEVGYYGYSRYIRDGNVTKCNIFAGDVMRAMQVPLPTKDDLGGVDGGGSVTAGAQRLNSWLNGNKTWSSSYPTGPQQGWRKIDIYNQGDLDLLLSYVRAGKPALASTGDHIAVIRPDQEVSQLTKPNLGNLVIAQAGAKNLNRGHLSDVDGWRNIGYQNVQYFVRR